MGEGEGVFDDHDLVRMTPSPLVLSCFDPCDEPQLRIGGGCYDDCFTVFSRCDLISCWFFVPIYALIMGE